MPIKYRPCYRRIMLEKKNLWNAQDTEDSEVNCHNSPAECWASRRASIFRSTSSAAASCEVTNAFSLSFMEFTADFSECNSLLISTECPAELVEEVEPWWWLLINASASARVPNFLWFIMNTGSESADGDREISRFFYRKTGPEKPATWSWHSFHVLKTPVFLPLATA